jgi:hypothetical protein
MRRALVLLLLVFPASVDGRVGETLEQCRVRYGQEIATNGESFVLLKNGFTVTVWLTSNRVETIGYSADEAHTLGSDHCIQFLFMNGGTNRVIEKDDEAGFAHMHTADGKLTAWTGTNMLVICTEEKMQRDMARIIAQHKADLKKQLEGF